MPAIQARGRASSKKPHPAGRTAKGSNGNRITPAVAFQPVSPATAPIRATSAPASVHRHVVAAHGLLEPIMLFRRQAAQALGSRPGLCADLRPFDLRPVLRLGRRGRLALGRRSRPNDLDPPGPCPGTNRRLVRNPRYHRRLHFPPRDRDAASRTTFPAAMRPSAEIGLSIGTKAN